LEHGGLYAGMWNRQREAEEAREKLRLAGEDAVEAVVPVKTVTGVDGGVDSNNNLETLVPSPIRGEGT
jgi:hypothetical protein